MRVQVDRCQGKHGVEENRSTEVGHLVPPDAADDHALVWCELTSQVKWSVQEMQYRSDRNQPCRN